jgi:hypothetical protein
MLLTLENIKIIIVENRKRKGKDREKEQKKEIKKKANEKEEEKENTTYEVDDYLRFLCFDDTSENEYVTNKINIIILSLIYLLSVTKIEFF